MFNAKRRGSLNLPNPRRPNRRRVGLNKMFSGANRAQRRFLLTARGKALLAIQIAKAKLGSK